MDSSSVMHMPHKLNLDVGFRCTKPDHDGGYILSMETGDGSEEDTLPDPKTNATRNSDVLYMPFQKSHEDFNSPSDFSSIVCSSPTIEVKQKSSLSVEGLMSTGVHTGNDGDTKDDNLPDPETSVMNNTDILYISSQNCRTCLNPCSCSDDFNSATDEKHSFTTEEGSMSNIAYVRDCSVRADPSEYTRSCTAMEVVENFHALKLDCPPKSLLSTRKAISPTSQAKPCQAVDADYLNDDIGLSKCRERLSFGKQSTIRASSTGSNLQGTEVNMRVAVDRAGEVEETTRMWLSMMARDCSRFCRIMRSSGNKAATAPTSSYGLHKDRKKIFFADEVGGPLCHVKVFEDQLASLCGSECDTEKFLGN
ncbi:uncharacterized protein LOC122079220 isoform X1 [Macadamia integrifolia]|uniref:uncharacterized protein LOC122079220 isoform X1 n=1 Tax=Macadamia integrifolia TaxID=60698 RepID=UPI001C4FAA06|nr:uncharacterized protein LOC122079220 isoform X1 [Macadamia integrifolia]XP_042501426.1 uncharacterized protein LOC122079220 isoform X1 [Macadamia integrifolia]XP_042501427.1 uncharacterized protein LOC122079220 isoform X1 [Macadamia integrifolia]